MQCNLLAKKRDVIEYPVEDTIDLSGWDIRKALNLFRKSNPPLLEWLQSPIIYREDPHFVTPLRGLLSKYYSPRSCFFHYMQMARGNMRDYLKGDTVWTKKYFYILRPLLACRWIEKTGDIVPMEFASLVETCAPRGEFYDSLQALLRKKLSGDEMDQGPRIPIFHEFIDTELARFESLNILKTASGEPGITALNQLMMSVVLYEDVCHPDPPLAEKDPVSSL